MRGGGPLYVSILRLEALEQTGGIHIACSLCKVVSTNTNNHMLLK